jgi:protein TonB
MIFREIILLFTLFLIFISCQPQSKDESQVVHPKLLSDRLTVEYPEEAIEKQSEGKVILALHINEQGKVDTAGIYRSSGSSTLDMAAFEMISRLEFEPGTIDGELADFWIQLPVNFDLEATDISWGEIKEWRDKVLALLVEIDMESRKRKNASLDSLYDEYQYMVRKSAESRSRSANEGIFAILNEPLASKWMAYKEIWPLGFLLLQDYIDRFPESQYTAQVKTDLAYYLEREAAKLRKRVNTREDLRDLETKLSYYLMSIRTPPRQSNYF